MTGYGLIASLVWSAVAVFALFVVSVHVDHYWDMREQHVRQDEEIVIPDDLLGVALGETEKWAQEETLKVIRERYTTYKNWNKVRAAMGVAKRDDE